MPDRLSHTIVLRVNERAPAAAAAVLRHRLAVRAVTDPEVLERAGATLAALVERAAANGATLLTIGFSFTDPAALVIEIESSRGDDARRGTPWGTRTLRSVVGLGGPASNATRRDDPPTDRFARRDERVQPGR